MSSLANTYEELTIHNVNQKTAHLAAEVGEYLLKIEDILSISLCCDDIELKSTTESKIQNDSLFYPICKNLANAKEIHLCLRSVSYCGAYKRLEFCFMKSFTDDNELKENVIYKSTDYYDTDTGIELYLYDQNGLQALEYQNSFESVADIEKWVSYTPDIYLFDEEQKDNAVLHKTIRAIFEKLCFDCFGWNEDDFDDQFEDDWEEFGEIILDGAVSFTTGKIQDIVNLANQLVVQVEQAKLSEFRFELYAVPDGKDDYNFASVAIVLKNGVIEDSYCRF